MTIYNGRYDAIWDAILTCAQKLTTNHLWKRAVMPNVPGLWQTQSVQCSGTMHWRELKLLSWERGGRKSTTRGGTGLPTRHTTTETLHDWMHRGTDLTTFKQVLTYSQHTHTHTCLTALFPVPERQNQSGFYWSKRQWVAVSSAGPYASLHLAPDR